MNGGKKIGKLRALSEGLGVDPWQVAVLLGERGIKIDPVTEEFDATPILDLLATPNTHAKAKETRAEVIRSHRERLRESLIKAGLSYMGDDFPRGALLKFRFVNMKSTFGGAGRAVNILCYVAISLNRFGQVSFTVNHLRDEQVHWVALVAAPFDRTFLYRREELQKQAGENNDSLSLTIRAGTSDANAYERRVGELLHGTE